MKIAFISPTDDPHEWQRLLAEQFPEVEMEIWPDIPDPAAIRAALVWKPPHGALASLPKLELIQGLGMGVDYLFDDPTLPDVPIARLVDDNLVEQMSEYIIGEVLRVHRRSDDFQQLQREHRWEALEWPDSRRFPVGLLGLGAIGQDAAQKLRLLGFPVLGWSRHPKQLDGIRCLHGKAGLQECLAEARVLACVLPLTPETESILNSTTLGQLPRGAYLINCARGGHLVEEDLLNLLASEHLVGATLDVFRQEPLPAAHPFWDHPRIRITPHIAGVTNAWAAAPVVAENLRRLQQGLALQNTVNHRSGY